MKKNPSRCWDVLAGIAVIVLAAYSIDSIIIQHKFSSLADDIDRMNILSVDLVHFPLDLKTQIPINTSSFEGFDSITQQLWSIKQVTFGGDYAKSDWNEIATCMRNTRFSRSILQINPFFPDLRVKVMFRSKKNEILRTLYFDSEGIYGLADGNRGVFYSGCLFSMVKRHLMVTK